MNDPLILGLIPAVLIGFPVGFRLFAALIRHADARDAARRNEGWRVE